MPVLLQRKPRWNSGLRGLFSSDKGEGTVVKPWLAGTQQPYASKAAEVISTSDHSGEFHSLALRDRPRATMSINKAAEICKGRETTARSTHVIEAPDVAVCGPPFALSC